MLQAVAPLLLLIVAGMALARFGGFDEERRRALDWLLFFVLMPAFIVSRLATAEIDPAAVLDLLLAVAGLVAAMGVALMMARVPICRLLSLSGPRFTSFLQGVIRNNFFIPFALVEIGFEARPGAALPDGLAALMAIAVVFNIVPATAASVFALTRYGHGGGTRLSWVRALAGNPLVLAALLGALLGGSGVGLAAPFATALRMLGDGVLGLALIAVGAGLRIEGVPGAGPAVLLSALLKLLVIPALAWAITWAAGAEPAVRLAAVLLHAAPTAAGAYILARQLGGDAETMASMISLQTAACLLTMPLVLWLAA